LKFNKNSKVKSRRKLKSQKSKVKATTQNLKLVKIQMYYLWVGGVKFLGELSDKKNYVDNKTVLTFKMWF